MLSCSKTNQLTQEEKSLLMTEQDFLDILTHLPRKKLGKYSKEHNYLDRSTTLDYEAEVSGQFYMTNSLASCASSLNATKLAYGLRTGALIGLKIGTESNKTSDLEIPLKNQFEGKATLTLLKMNNHSVGNVFTYIHENKVWFVIITGIYFDNERDFDDFFAGHINQIKTVTKLNT